MYDSKPCGSWLTSEKGSTDTARTPDKSQTNKNAPGLSTGGVFVKPG
jgi:hypothetical protein